MSLGDLVARVPPRFDHLSVLASADLNCITYYVGESPNAVLHLRDCALICRPSLDADLPGVHLIPVDDPQLAFYRLSAAYKVDYLDYSGMTERAGARIHMDAVVPSSCRIGPGCILGACVLGENVRIEANCVIYARSRIGDRSVIEPNTVIGATGVMWAWDGESRVFLEQLGRIEIGKDCFIGSNVTIVRGSANEATVIGDETCMAHGTMIGHGCRIGVRNHLANNVSFGGGVVTGENCFFGSACTVPPSKNICSETVVGAGALVSKDTVESGVYVGMPARRVSAVKQKMSGIPKWDV